ncbi:LuxR family two component transcriptional regulator [Actinocorallia herbida]|uniref:LuxR family two component transcriptional regulator n=1 Tax=Actinocorallia herbida TaxID=58109 RepID=A0A3N1D8L1_9ACTN|nr:response regulator transcription factor [Actinocorallia herbida]ROO89872.1 LuxR family two component transcriptional regulator [Actinocorallia herbida]
MRVVIAEDSVLLREGLVRLLADEGVQTVGACGDGDALVALVAEHRPDLAITDVRMPPGFGDEGLRAALAVRPTPVLVLSQYVEEQYAAELLGGDARGVGYLLKERISDVAEFTAAVHEVAGGGTVIDPEVVTQLLGRNPLRDLTPREREVLGLMARGLSNAGLAHALFIGEGAVEKHISAIFAKLGLAPSRDVHRRVQAVLAQLRGGE